MIEILKDVFENDFFTGGFVLGLIAAITLYFKKWTLWIWKRIERKLYYSITIEFTDELYNYFEMWLKHNHDKEYRRLIASIGKTIYNPNENANRDVAPSNENEDEKEDTPRYRQENDLIFIKYKGSLLKITKSRRELQQTQSLFNLFFDSYVISTLFKRKLLKQLIDEVIEYNQQFKPPPEKTVWVFTHDDFGHWNNRIRLTPKTMKQLVLPFDMKKEIIEDVERFLDSREWYEERAIPYKRGYAFYGSPGNGKTSLAGALGHHTKRDIYAINLSELKDSALKTAFNQVSKNSIVLIEDIDAIFDGRKSVKTSLTFSNFLQCLDGVISQNDIITIITTNHIDKLDPALLRDGRIDLKLHIENPNSELINKYLSLFFTRNVSSLNGVYNPKYSMSTIQNMCLKSNNPEEVIETLLNEFEVKCI